VSTGIKLLMFSYLRDIAAVTAVGYRAITAMTLFIPHRAFRIVERSARQGLA
jgi:hypothetical protein